MRARARQRGRRRAAGAHRRRGPPHRPRGGRRCATSSTRSASWSAASLAPPASFCSAPMREAVRAPGDPIGRRDVDRPRRPRRPRRGAGSCWPSCSSEKEQRRGGKPDPVGVSRHVMTSKHHQEVMEKDVHLRRVKAAGLAAVAAWRSGCVAARGCRQQQQRAAAAAAAARPPATTRAARSPCCCRRSRRRATRRRTSRCSRRRSRRSARTARSSTATPTRTRPSSSRRPRPP